MESHVSTQIKVGIFIIVGTALIFASLFFLGADRSLFTRYIRIHSYFDQVQGLAEGSVVSLSGVTVGNVESITFLSEKNSLDVKMKIDEDYIGRIRQGSQVEIRTQGALGDKFVYIIPGDPKNPQAKEGDNLDVAPATDIIGVLSERGSEASKIFDILNELQKMTHAVNAENRLVRIMSNLETASASFNQSSKDAQKFFTQINSLGGGEKLGHSFEKLDAILAKIERGEGSLGAFINDPTLHNKLKNLLGGSTQKKNMKSLLRTSIKQSQKE